MADGGNITIKVLLDYSQLQRGVNNVRRELNNIQATGIENVDRSTERATQTTRNWLTSVSKAGDSLNKAGSTLSKTLTPAIVGLGAASVASAVSIDTSLTNVRKTVDGTEEDYQRLKQAAIEFSKTNAVSASQILDIQALGAQLGFSIDELQEFGEVVSGLDIATNMDADTAATQLAQFANITGLAHDKIRNYASAIVDLGNNFATTESDISNMAMRIAGTGTTIGLTTPEILGMATALSSVGIEAEAGGTAISTIMSQIDKDVAHGSEAMQLWANVAGMSADQFAEAWRTKPAEAFSAVLMGMNAATEESGALNLMLEDLGVTAIRQSDALKRLAQHPELLAKAMQTANKAYNENVALGKEVENRNNSLAAKFEMLKNRAQAVGEQIGGPLATALLDAIDAAEPLFKAIADGAKAFSEMDKGEQQAVLTTLALAAALGPVLKLVGSGMKGFSSFANGAKSAAAALGRLGGATATYNSQTGRFTGSIKASNVALGALKGALAGLGIAAAIAVLSALIDAFVKAKERSEKLTKATKGLHDAISQVPTASSAAVSGLDKMGESTEEVCKRVDDLIGKQGELADTIAERNSQAAADMGLVASYRDTIAELTEAYDENGNAVKLTAAQQAELKLAIEGLNSAAGTNFEVVQDESGAFRIMADGALVAKDAVLELADAEIYRIKQAALEESYADTYKQQLDVTRELAEVQRKRNQLLDEYGPAIEAAKNGDEEAAQSVSKYTGELDALNQREQELIGANDALTDSQEFLSDQMTVAKVAVENYDEGISRLISDLPEVAATLEASGQKSSEFAQALQEAGFKAQDLEAMGTDAIKSLAESFNGDISSIITACEKAGIEIPGKLADGIYAGQDSVVVAGDSVVAKVLSQFAGIDCTESGYNITAGLASGIDTGAFLAELSAQGVSESVIEAIRAIIEPANATGQEIDENLGAGIESNGAAETAAENTATAVENKLNEVPPAARNTGTNATSEFAASIEAGRPGVESAAQSNVAAANNALSQFETTAPSIAENSSAGFARGIGAYLNEALGQARSMANAAEHVNDNSGLAYGWGSHLGEMFAAGIRAMITVVSVAAQAVAAAAAAVLHFTKPDIGPLSEGTEVWGQELVENFAAGMQSVKNKPANVAMEIASAIKKPLESKMQIGAKVNLERLSSMPANIAESLEVGGFEARNMITARHQTQEINIHIDKFVNNTPEDERKLLSRISRGIAAQSATVVRGRGL